MFGARLRQNHVAAVSVLCLAGTGAAQEPAQFHPSVELPADLARVLRDYEEAWRARDPEKLAALFTEDGFVLSPDRSPVRGRDRIRRRYASSGGPLALRALAYAREGSIGYIIGAFARERGAPDIGKFTLTLRKIDDRWLIMSDMDNGNLRPEREPEPR